MPVLADILLHGLAMDGYLGPGVGEIIGTTQLVDPGHGGIMLVIGEKFKARPASCR